MRFIGCLWSGVEGRSGGRPITKSPAPFAVIYVQPGSEAPDNADKDGQVAPRHDRYVVNAGPHWRRWRAASWPPRAFCGQLGSDLRARSRSPGANRLVAIKVLLDGPLATDRQRHRFEREIELISRLRHPNIVTLYDTGVIRGRHYFAMEYVDGLPIGEW